MAVAGCQLAPIEESNFQTRSFCKTCGKDTPHEVHRGEGLIARLCVPCLVRAMSYDVPAGAAESLRQPRSAMAASMAALAK